MNSLQLRRVREICGLTQAELADQIGVQQAVIAMLERGARNPTDHILEQISSVTGFPTAFFFDYPLHEFPLGSLLYRKFNRLPSYAKIHSHRVIEQSFNVFMRMSERLRTIPLRIPKRLEEDPFTAAKLVRSGLGYDPEGPLRYLINRLERHEVIVIILSEEVKDLDAFSTWANGTTPVIVISPGKTGDRQRFNVEHELGHLILHQTLHSEFDVIEHEADQFAGELLFPEDSARQDLSAPVTLSGLAEFKVKWEISLQAIISRAFELSIINE